LYPKHCFLGMKSLFFVIIASFFITAFSPSVALAAGNNCLPVYGGGVTDKTVCPTPAPTVAPFPAFNSTTPRTTKGGLPIYPVAKNKSTPNTGPEEWSWISLFLLAGAGFYLRNKTTLAKKN
jgi:hypothetical protein